MMWDCGCTSAFMIMIMKVVVFVLIGAIAVLNGRKFAMRNIEHRYHCGLGAQERRERAQDELPHMNSDILLHFHNDERKCSAMSTGSMLCEIIGLEFHEEPEFKRYPQTVIQVCE